MIKKFANFSAFLYLSLSAQILLAAEQSAGKVLSNPPVGASALFETMLGLILVLSLIVFLAWLLRRTGRFQMTANGEMKIIASIALGPRERAVLLQVGEQQLLVGVTAQQINILHVLEKNVTSDKNEDISAGFANKLNKMMQQGTSKS
ncbi:flagellar biosynthetic protein FliO [Pseudomonadota bacterium]|nr:flagellar biosynthetic protein FliO [Pseudomonadota bacterium]